MAVASLGMLASASAAIAVGGDHGAESNRAKKSGIEVELVSASQREILDSNRLTVEVSSEIADKVRVRGAARPGKPARVAKARRARLEAGDSVTIKLRLTAAGRSRLAGCAELKLLIRARASETGDRLGDRDDVRDKAKESLLRDSAACAAGSPPPGGETGGGGGEDGGLGGSPTARCDPIDPSHCLHPWPNDLFTEPAATPTGRRVALDPLAMPRSRQGVPILPEPFNRSDGFSPGNLIVTKVPGLETPAAFDQTDPVDIRHLSEYDDPDQPVVVINADTGDRHLIWAELDANPENPDDVNLIIRPAVNFDEEGHYIVAMRNLKDADGNPIDAQEPFRVYRDNLPSSDPEVEDRRAHMEEIFDALAAADQPIARDDLYLAWDFTVASEQNLTERALHLRDDAFAELGDTDLADLEVEPGSSAPEFTVESVENFTVAQDSRIARRVEGTFTVPCYLNAPDCPTGSRFALPPDSNIPVRIPGNTMETNFVCLIPRVAADGLDPPAARPWLYGHGLLGSAGAVASSPQTRMMNEHNFVYCATDWVGFATQDAPNILLTLQDLNNFPSFVDRTQQGFLNFLYLGRLMIHPDGFASNPAFQTGLPLEPVLDPARLFYVGNSQGGILGGALAALAPDHEHAVLGVPGMNYSTLLRRSSDFHPYAEGEFTDVVCGELPGVFEEICNSAPGDTPLGLYDNYPNELERPLILSLIQMQWDRAEANGYAHHMTDDPYPNTPPHEVILDMAYGDHQVTNWATEVEARTIGARIRQPALYPGRSNSVQPYFGIPAIESYPFAGSALIVADVGPLRQEGTRTKGTNPPPPDEVPNREGVDPHGPDQSETIYGRNVITEFLRIGGVVIDGCAGRPCYIDGYTGAGG